ncbi:RING-type domain-containing protein [Pseudoscourfieldia marina]
MASSSSSASASTAQGGLREQLRQRQQKWFDERAASLERRGALEELGFGGEQYQQLAPAASNANANHVSASMPLAAAPQQPPQQVVVSQASAFSASHSAIPPSASAAAADPSAILDKITERLASRMRLELKSELETATATYQKNESQVNASMESYLASEIASHTCPICFELMLAPTRTPVLLFPCGHTFCDACLRQHIDVHGKGRCPVCRKSIASRAANVPLQQLIQSYASERNRVRPAVQAAPMLSARGVTGERSPGGTTDTKNNDDGDPNPDGASYVRKHRTLTMRRRILANEHTDSSVQLGELRRRLDASAVVSAHLAEEEEAALDRVRHAQEELELVRSHLQRQEETQRAVQTEMSEVEARVELLQRTLAPLDDELAKARYMVEAMAPERLGELDGVDNDDI